MKLVLLITSKIEEGMNVALAWQEIGAPGVTIIKSHGIHSLREKTKRTSVELPLHVTSMANALAFVIEHIEHTNHVLLALVEDAQVDALVNAAEEQLGDLYAPRTGVVFVLDVEKAVGVRDPRQDDEA